MGYLVKLAPKAVLDLAKIYQAIDAANSMAASKWYLGFRDAILSLDENPRRCPITPENAELRHLLYGHKPHIYRAIFRIDEKQKLVRIVHVRHGARHPIKPKKNAPIEAGL